MIINVAKKICFIALFFLSLSVKANGVWKPVAPSGGGGGGASCYHITFDAGTHGIRSLVGNGSIYGNVFTGFMWFPGLTSRGRTDCGQGAVGQCAWNYAYNNLYGNNNSVAVSALPILAAQPTGCY